MTVVLLLALIWAAVLVPPAIRSHTERKEAFLVSFGQPPVVDVPLRSHRPSPHIRRRRRIAGGLLVAMAVTLVVGLLPTFRVLLVVHLFLLDSFLAYVAMLAHRANRAARRSATVVVPARGAVAVEPRRRRSVRRTVLVPDLGRVAPAG